MANFCFNDVQFYGDAEALENLNTFIISTIDDLNPIYGGMWAFFSEEEPQSYCFDFSSLIENGKVYLNYMTRWKSNESDVIKIADLFKVSFIHDAFEPGNYIYQRCRYTYGGALEYAKMLQTEFGSIDFERDAVFPD